MPVNSLHELKREARVIDDDTSDVSSCADLVCQFPLRRMKPNSNCRFAIIILRYFSLVSHRKFQISSPASRPFYSSIHSLDQLSSSALSSLFFLLFHPRSLIRPLFLRKYISSIACWPAWWRHSSTNELAGLTSLIALLGDSSMSGLCAEKTRMFVLAYVLLVSRTSGLFVQAIARERSVTTNEPL